MVPVVMVVRGEAGLARATRVTVWLVRRAGEGDRSGRRAGAGWSEETVALISTDWPPTDGSGSDVTPWWWSAG